MPELQKVPVEEYDRIKKLLFDAYQNITKLQNKIRNLEQEAALRHRDNFAKLRSDQ